jgi:hypothetical protein
VIRVVIPYHLRNLAKSGAEVSVAVEGVVCVSSILDALEAQYPMLRGTIRDHVNKRRRPFLRFFACGEDVSLDPMDKQLPDAIAQGTEPFMVVGAVAGG